MSMRVSQVGTCTTPAARTVEGYSPRDSGVHGSLDAYVYVCDAHVETGREWLAGLQTYACATRPAPGTRCGRLVDFRAAGGGQ